MTGTNLWIQAIGLMGTALFCLSYQCRTNKNLFRVQFLSYAFYTVHFLLLGAWTGGISYILNAFRSWCLGSNSSFLKSRTMCAVICALQLLAMVFTWNGWITMLPVIANIAATLGNYSYNGQKIRAAAMFVNSPLWIVYDVLVGSWAGILDEAITEISGIVSIIRYGWENLDQVSE